MAPAQCSLPLRARPRCRKPTSGRLPPAQELFQLIFRELFDAAYGMFVLHEGARTLWPRASDIDMSTEFQLVGTMLALAVYNGHTLGVAFPMALWRCRLRALFNATACAGAHEQERNTCKTDVQRVLV